MAVIKNGKIKGKIGKHVKYSTKTKFPIYTLPTRIPEL